jgi:DNA-binding transcriptional MerR regulator
MTVTDGPWKIGDLAAAAGLTVRALRHFDDIGLLRPTRSLAGHREYGTGEVRRLRHILALRKLGVPLADIGPCLDGGLRHLEPAARDRLARLDSEIGEDRQVRRELVAVLQAIDGAATADRASLDDILDRMEALMNQPTFSADQLARARARHDDSGFAQRFSAWQRRGADVVAGLQAELDRGTDPADPTVQALARDWQTVLLELVDGDRATLSAVYAKIESKGPEAATRGILTADVWEYLRRALAGAGPAIPPPGRRGVRTRRGWRRRPGAADRSGTRGQLRPRTRPCRPDGRRFPTVRRPRWVSRTRRSGR